VDSLHLPENSEGERLIFVGFVFTPPSSIRDVGDKDLRNKIKSGIKALPKILSVLKAGGIC